MNMLSRCFTALTLALSLALPAAQASVATAPKIATPVSAAVSLPVLVYHRFGPTVADSMTMKTVDFESNLRWLADNGYKVIPLKQYIDYRLGKGPAPAAKSVVITIDDGHKTVYSDVLPLLKRYKVPVTLFIYPSVISNASYGMTWEQLKELVKTGYVDIQSHTYWHPNFKQEKKRLTPEEFKKFTNTQLAKSRSKLEQVFGTKVNVLAWPFGIYTSEVQEMAKAAGYDAAFTIDRRHAGSSDQLMEIPRYLLTAGDHDKRFAQIITNQSSGVAASTGQMKM